MRGCPVTRFQNHLQQSHYFWTAQTSQIYREWCAGEKDGWVTANAGRPERKAGQDKHFLITETGKRGVEQVAEWKLPQASVLVFRF